jgi:hypothetical protein
MKKLGYFTILIVCILLLRQNAGAQTPMKSSVIGIQYIGPSDKPVTPIVIAQSREDADWFKSGILKLNGLEMTDVHVVSSSLMEELIASVAKHVENGNSRATAVVLITVVTHSRTRELHLSRNDAIKALERLTESSKGSPALETDIVHFKTRISP